MINFKNKFDISKNNLDIVLIPKYNIKKNIK